MTVCEYSTDDIVRAVVDIGERISDMTLHPYQRPFANQIVKDLLLGDASSITALFSRQCLEPSAEILVPNGWKQIKDLQKGDKIVTLSEEGELVLDKVQDIWKVNVERSHTLRTSTTRDTVVSPQHRFYSARRQAWVTAEFGLRKRAAIEGICLLPDNCEVSEDGIPTNIPTSRPSGLQEARVTAAMLWGKEPASGSVAELVGKSLKTSHRTQAGVQRFCEIFGLRPEVEMLGALFTLELGDQTTSGEMKAVLGNRKDILKALMTEVDIDIKPYKNREYRAYLTLRCNSNGFYRRFLLNFLEILGIRVEKSETTKIEIHSPESVRTLLPFLQTHQQIAELRELFASKTLKTTPHIDIDEVNSMLANEPKIWNMLTQMRSEETFTRWRKSGLAPKFSVKKAVQTACPERLGEFIPIREFKNVSEVRLNQLNSVAASCGYEMFDMETEHTGTYISNCKTSHNSGKSEAIAVVIIGCLLWLPALALEYRTDKRFRKFAKGCWIGVFAPIIMQSKNIYNRVRRRLDTPAGRELLYSLGVTFLTNQSQAFELSNGSKLFASPAGPDANIESQTFHLVIGDESQDISGFKWNKSVVPMTTMTAGTKVLVGTANTLKSHFYHLIHQNRLDAPHNHFEVNHTVPSKYIPEYKKSVEKAARDMGVDSDEFRMAYMNEFIFARGMMIEPHILEFRTAKNPRGMILQAYDAFNEYDEYTGDLPVAMGIDIGKKNDSTVCVPMAIDVNNPIEVLNYLSYMKYVMGWLEMVGDDIDSQIPRMVNYIRKMRAQTIAVDSTGKGETYFDKLSKALPDLNVIPYVFSRPSKSILYKGVLSEISTGGVAAPGGDLTRKMPEFLKFIRQMGDMQKEYYGQYLDCRAPNGRNFHDDYPTAFALALYAARGHAMNTVKIVDNPFFKRRRR
jgi:hypothetical protein